MSSSDISGRQLLSGVAMSATGQRRGIVTNLLLGVGVLGLTTLGSFFFLSASARRLNMIALRDRDVLCARLREMEQTQTDKEVQFAKYQEQLEAASRVVPANDEEEECDEEGLVSSSAQPGEEEGVADPLAEESSLGRSARIRQALHKETLRRRQRLQAVVKGGQPQQQQQTEEVAPSSTCVVVSTPPKPSLVVAEYRRVQLWLSDIDRLEKEALKHQRNIYRNEGLDDNGCSLMLSSFQSKALTPQTTPEVSLECSLATTIPDLVIPHGNIFFSAPPRSAYAAPTHPHAQDHHHQNSLQHVALKHMDGNVATVMNDEEYAASTDSPSSPLVALIEGGSSISASSSTRAGANALALGADASSSPAAVDGTDSPMFLSSFLLKARAAQRSRSSTPPSNNSDAAPGNRSSGSQAGGGAKKVSFAPPPMPPLPFYNTHLQELDALERELSEKCGSCGQLVLLDDGQPFLAALEGDQNNSKLSTSPSSFISTSASLLFRDIVLQFKWGDAHFMCFRAFQITIYEQAKRRYTSTAHVIASSKALCKQRLELLGQNYNPSATEKLHLE